MSFLPHDWVLFKKLFLLCISEMWNSFKYPLNIPKMLAPGHLHPSEKINIFSNSFTNARCNYRYEKIFRFFVIIFHVSAIFIQTHSIMLEHMPQLPSLSLIFWFTDPPFHGYISKRVFKKSEIKIVLSAWWRKEKIYYCLLAPSLLFTLKRKNYSSSFSFKKVCRCIHWRAAMDEILRKNHVSCFWPFLFNFFISHASRLVWETI